jgi:hypothetical protein
MSGSVIVKTVVRRLQRERDIHLQQRLSHGMRFLNIAHIHLRDSFFRLHKLCTESSVLHELISRPLGFVRCLRATSGFAGKSKRECGLALWRRRAAMITHALLETIRSPNIKVSAALCENIHPMLRHRLRQFAHLDRRHRQKPLEQIRKSVNMRLEGLIHCRAILTPGCR